MRRLLAACLVIFAGSLATGILPAAATTEVPCYCRYTNLSRLLDDAEKTYCPNEVGLIGYVPENDKTNRCTNLCAQEGHGYVGPSDVDPDEYSVPEEIAANEPKHCVFAHQNFLFSVGGTPSITGWKSEQHENCRNPLNTIKSVGLDKCAFCYCKYKAAGSTPACAGKTTFVHHTSFIGGCPALCERLGLDPDGDAVTKYDDKCHYSEATGCQTPFNAGAGNCMSEIKDAAMTKALTLGRGSVLTLPLPLSNISVPGVIGRIMNALLGIVGGVALLLFVWGGLRWMLARGNPDEVGKARQTITWAALGLLAIFSSYAILNFIISALRS